MGGIRSFSSIYIEDFKRLSKAIVGLEMEFYSTVPYYKLIELLNLNLRPAVVKAVGAYHSGVDVSDYEFKIEPDASGGPDMVELITGPMTYFDARLVLCRAIEFIKKYGKVDARCSVHVNVSYSKDSGLDMADLNRLALILDFDEEFVYERFPERRNSIYARSVKDIIPFKDFDDFRTAAQVVAQNVKLPEETKYYGINVAGIDRGWVEYRYIGGDYIKAMSETLDVFDYCVSKTMDVAKQATTEEHKTKLMSYMSDRIGQYSKFKSYDNFLAHAVGVEVSVDRSNDYDIVSTFYSVFAETIYDFFSSGKVFAEEGEMIQVNYDSDASVLQIIGATASNVVVDGIDLLECELSECSMTECNLVDCDVDSSHHVGCKIDDSRLLNSKLQNCEIANGSTMEGCYFDGGVILDADMIGGVLRAANVTVDAYISDSTVTYADGEFWMTHGHGQDKKKPGTKKK